MNGYLVIALFTVILALTLYWLQGRQSKTGSVELDKDRVKEIKVVKADDWTVKEEVKEPEQETPVVEPEVKPGPQEKEVATAELDISQLSGVGPKYRALLKEAGITSVNKIAEYDPESLLKLLHETNERTGITKRPPTMFNVEAWLEAAKTQLA